MAPNDVTPKHRAYVQQIYTSHNSERRGKVKFRVNDIVRISSYKGVFEKGYTPNWSTELFKIVQVCPTSPVTYKLEDLKGNPILGGFYTQKYSLLVFPISGRKSTKKTT